MMLSPLLLALVQEVPVSSPIEILRTWTGKELDHLGIGISALGDVDGDGTPDFILGAMYGAYTFYFGPGYAEVVSGKDGSVLYTVRGRAEMRGCQSDAFGDTIAVLGDLDRDGVPEFAVGAWNYHEFSGYVRVFSGKTGTELATIDGSSSLGSSIVALGDLDADSVPDFALGDDITTLVSGADFHRLGECSGRVLARAGDLLLGELGSGFVLVSIPRFEIQKRIAEACSSPTFVCGDLDRDGWPDLLRTKDCGGDPFERPSTPRPPSAQFLSGKDGHVLRTFDMRLPILPEPSTDDLVAGSLGDVDGDGVPDVFMQSRVGIDGSCVQILSGSTGSVLAQVESASRMFGRKFVPLGDIDHDGRPEFLLSDYESQEGTRCGGAVHLVHIRVSTK